MKELKIPGVTCGSAKNLSLSRHPPLWDPDDGECYICKLESQLADSQRSELLLRIDALTDEVQKLRKSVERNGEPDPAEITS